MIIQVYTEKNQPRAKLGKTWGRESHLGKVYQPNIEAGTPSSFGFQTSRVIMSWVWRLVGVNTLEMRKVLRNCQVKSVLGCPRNLGSMISK